MKKPLGHRVTKTLHKLETRLAECKARGQAAPKLESQIARAKAIVANGFRIQGKGTPENVVRSEWWRRYNERIHSLEWLGLKQAIIRKRGANCEVCGVLGSDRRLEMHHLTYRNLGEEKPEDLQLLCLDCHKWAHIVKRSSINRNP